MSWIATRWSFNDESFSVCLRKGKERTIVSFPSVCTLLVSVSQGINEDAVDILRSIFSTDKVIPLGDTYYKVNFSPEVDINTGILDGFRDVIRMEHSVPTQLSEFGFSFHQAFDESFTPKDAEKYEPHVCFWDLEVEIAEHKGFPDARVNPIIMASICDNITNKTRLLTTIPEAYTDGIIIPDAEIVPFNSEREMLEALFQSLLEYDIDVGYFSEQFDWPYLIKRLEILGSNIIEESGCKHSTIRSQSFKGMSDNFICVDCPTTDHVDLYKFCAEAFSHLPNQKLNTIAKAFLGRGKNDVEITELSKLRNLPTTPSFSLKKLVNQFMEYAKKDAVLVREIWNILYPSYRYFTDTLGVPYSEVARGDEYKSLIYRTQPALFFGSQNQVDSRIPSSSMNVGRYQNVHIYSIGMYMLAAMRSSTDQITREFYDIIKGVQYSWLIAGIFLHPKIAPRPMFEGSVVIGNNDKLVYTTAVLPGAQQLEEHQQFFGICTGSWIAKNITTDQFTYHGIANSTRHPFPLAKRAVEIYINKLIKGEKIVLSTKGGSFPIDFGEITMQELIMKAGVTAYNLNTYRELMSEEEIAGLSKGETSRIDIQYVLGVGGKNIRATDGITGNSVDLTEYSKKILAILKKIPSK